MIDNLKYKNVISIIKKYETEGHSALQVLTDDLNLYVLKFPIIYRTTILNCLIAKN